MHLISSGDPPERFEASLKPSGSTFAFVAPVCFFRLVLLMVLRFVHVRQSLKSPVWLLV